MRLRPWRHLPTASVVAAALVLGCQTEPPQSPVTGALKGPLNLVSPANGERFKQNDASLECPSHAARGRGFRIAFDWQDVEGAAAYKIVFWHTGSQFPAVQRDVTVSSFDETSCNAFVIDSNLDHWVWRVAAVGPADNRNQADTLWSEQREYGFEPCRLEGGVPCSAPPP